jgi:hypothetical protein
MWHFGNSTIFIGALFRFGALGSAFADLSFKHDQARPARPFYGK